MPLSAYPGFLQQSPAAWFFTAAVLVGVAVARVARRLPSGTPRGWALAVTYVSLALALALAGLFVPGPEQAIDLIYVYYAAGCATIAAIGFRFKRAVGAPLVAVVGTAIVATGIVLEPWVPNEAGGPTPLATAYVVGTAGDRVTVAFFSEDGIEVVRSFEGARLRATVDVATFPDLYVYLARRRWYRSARFDDDSQGPPDLLHRAVDAGLLPGVSFQEVSSMALTPHALTQYQVFATEAGLIMERVRLGP